MFGSIFWAPDFGNSHVCPEEVYLGAQGTYNSVLILIESNYASLSLLLGAFFVVYNINITTEPGISTPSIKR